MLNSAETKAFCLSLKAEDITKDLIDTKFSYTYDPATKKRIPPEISFQTEFILKAGEYKDHDGKPVNKSDVKTNAGQYIVNTCIYGRCPRMQAVLGYIAKPFDGDVIVDNESIMAGASMEGKIEAEDWAKYFDSIQWLGFTFNTNVAASFTPNTIRVLPEVKKARKELYAKHKEEIDNGNTVAAVKIEKELTKIAKERLKDDVGMILYDSKCKPKFGNQYKNSFVTRGPMWDPSKEKFDVVSNAFSDGVRKEDIAPMGTSVITGSYTKCCMTSVAGYITKKLFTVYQGVSLDKYGSDCHTKKYRTVTITNKNASAVMNRFILDGNKLVELTADVMPKYIGKKVKMRSPLYCLGGETICHKCMGSAFYKIGIKNVGLTTSSLGSNLLNRFNFMDPCTSNCTVQSSLIAGNSLRRQSAAKPLYEERSTTIRIK